MQSIYPSYRALLAALLVSASLAGTASHAAVVVHDNRDGTFKWWTGIRNTDATELPGTFLDITRPASEQTGERLPGTLGQWYRPNESSSGPARRFFEGDEVEIATEEKTLWWNGRPITPYAATREYYQGEHVAPDALWFEQSNYFFHLPFSGSLSEGTAAISPRAYLGIRAKLDGQWHYGWILFEDFKTPLMWAYETEADTPIQIPVPAPSAMVLGGGVGSWLIASRRRK